MSEDLAKNKKHTRATSQTTQKALTVIEALTTVADSGFISLIELRKKTQIDKAVVYRILNTLLDSGYLEKKESKYRLGLKLLQLSMNGVRHQSMVDLVHPHLVELSAEVGERAFLSVIDGTEVVQIDKVEGNPRLRVVSEIGSRFPLHCTASGKVYLASLAEEERPDILRKLTLEKLTKFTVHSERQILANLLEVSMAGYAVSDREYQLHECAIAAPLLKHHSEFIAAIGLAGSTITFTRENRGRAIPVLLNHAEKLSATLTLKD